MTFKTIGLAAILAATALGGVQVAAAQQPAPAPAQEQPAQQQPAPDDTKLNSFVVAFLEVDRIGKEYAPKLQQTQSPDEQAKVREEAGKAMVDAVEKQQGITVDEYNAIIEQAQADPDLANRINTKLRESAPQ